MEKQCICLSDKKYEECCGRFIEGEEYAPTAIELMRSRYSAYVLKNAQYLYDTCSSSLQNIDDIKAIEDQNIEWIGLKILSFSDYEVTFIAYYKEDNAIQGMQEHSFFILESGKLKYDRGDMQVAKISRNNSCPCGSGKKYKKCCA